MHPLCGALPEPFVLVCLHVVPWSLIGILMHFLAAEPYSTEGHLYLTRYIYGTIS